MTALETPTYRVLFFSSREYTGIPSNIFGFSVTFAILETSRTRTPDFVPTNTIEPL